MSTKAVITFWFVAGLASLGLGLYVIYPPALLIVGGVFMISCALCYEWETRDKDEQA